MAGQQPSFYGSPPGGGYPPPGRPIGHRQRPVMSRMAAIFAMAGCLVFGVAFGAVAAAGSKSSHNAASPSSQVTVTVTASAAAQQKATAPPAPSKKAPAPATVKMPDVTGENGAVAEAKLNTLGLTNITYGSADPSASIVVLPANWKVVSQDPRAGARVKAAGSTIVLTMKKIA